MSHQLHSATVLPTGEQRRSKRLHESKRFAPSGGTQHLIGQSNNSEGGVAKGTVVVESATQENLEELLEWEELLTAESIDQLL